ncbi:MAG: cytochrome P450 [Nocardioides sp.]|nr:cytochrome P450 [Nocardioides sp.]
MTQKPTYPLERGRCPFDPPPELLRMQREEPISRVTLWDGSAPWLVTGYDNVRTVLADPRASANSDLPGYPANTPAIKESRRHARTFINQDDPEHAANRRLLTQDFMVRRMEALRPRIQEIVDGLIDDMLAGPKPVDLVQAFALPVPSLVICELLGVPYEDRDFFHAISKRLVASGTTPEEAAAGTKELLAYLGGLIDQKLTDPGEDMLSRLAVEQVATGGMTRDDLAKIGRLLLVAGHETTANMIALGTTALLEHPDQLAKVRETDDPKLIANTVEELLRYLTITHTGRRRVALEDIEIGGQVIRAGEGIVVAGDAANRDVAAFPEPDRLDVERKARHHVAFGFGVHQCLGQPLARIELQLVYGTLYRRIPTLALAAPVQELRFKHDMAVYGLHELPVTW